MAAGVSALGSAIGGAAGGAAGPSSADAIFTTNLSFDNSGWNVAFGNSKLDSTNEKVLDQGAEGSTGASSNEGYFKIAALIVGAIVAVKAIKAFAK
jgi:hypothetical protein